MTKRGSSSEEFLRSAGCKWSLRTGWFIMVGVAGLLVVHSLAGCGKVGSPIPPERIGIAAKVEEERRQAQAVEGTGKEPGREMVEPGASPPGEEPAKEEEEIVLPPLRPIGTQ